MNRLSNTPPDGDFVRYVERLTAQTSKSPGEPGQMQITPAEDLRQPTRTPTHQIKIDEKATDASRPDLLASFAGIGILRSLRWIFVAWIATQLLDRLLPGAGWLIVPAIFCYAIWVFIRVNENRGGGLLRELEIFLNPQNKNPPRSK